MWNLQFIVSKVAIICEGVFFWFEVESDAQDDLERLNNFYFLSIKSYSSFQYYSTAQGDRIRRKISKLFKSAGWLTMRAICHLNVSAFFLSCLFERKIAKCLLFFCVYLSYLLLFVFFTILLHTCGLSYWLLIYMP